MELTSLPIPLGVASDGSPVFIDVAGLAAHLAIQGQTRSGKSQCEYNILGRLASEPAVRVVGCDPSRLMLAPFAERGEPLIALGDQDCSYALAVLAWVRDQADARIAQLVRERADKITGFSRELPLIVVVLEEYAALLEAAEDEDLASGRRAAERFEPQIRRLVRQIVSQSAKAGVRVLLSTQRAEANVLGGASRSNFGVRMSFRVDNPDSVRMLHPAADAGLCAVVASFQPGVGLLDRPDGPSAIVRGPVTEYQQYVDRVLSFRRACDEA